jgi:hypothetical protein
VGPNEVAARVAALYGWKDEPLAGETAPRLASSFAPPRPASDDLRLDSRVALGPTAAHFADHYLGAPGEGRHVIVKIAEHSSPAEARMHLAMVLNEWMTILPSCRERGLDLGDMAYCGPDDPPLSALFVRGNVLVEVASVGSTPVAVADMAADTDRQILDHIEARKGTDDAESI